MSKKWSIHQSNSWRRRWCRGPSTTSTTGVNFRLSCVAQNDGWHRAYSIAWRRPLLLWEKRPGWLPGCALIWGNNWIFSTTYIWAIGVKLWCANTFDYDLFYFCTWFFSFGMGVRQLNVLAELIVLSVCFLCTTFKIFPRHWSRRWTVMYEFVCFKIALPVAIHCFHPYCVARVKFLYASSMCYDVVYHCVNYISLYRASAMHMA